MNYYDKESRILDSFRLLSSEEILCVTGSGNEKSLIDSILDDEQWKKWIESAGKDDPPPDYYNSTTHIMMDVMRVGDHPAYSPVNRKESEIQKEIAESGIMASFPNVECPLVNAITDLPTDEDHNYNFYYENFNRVVNKHKKHIASLYEKNHPGFKTVFFIMDETSGGYAINYGIADDGMSFRAAMHLWWLDSNFMNCILNSDIAFLIWYTPYVMITTMEIGVLDLPKAVVIDVAEMRLHKDRLQKYNSRQMKAIEK